MIENFLSGCDKHARFTPFLCRSFPCVGKGKLMAFSVPCANQISPPSFPNSSSFSNSNHHRRRIRASVRSRTKPDVASAEDVQTVAAEGRVKLDRRKSHFQAKETVDSRSEGLQLLYDDGFGSESVIDFLDAAREMIRPDGGPPRWFCPVECGRPIKGSPVLLFLPGLDGVGMGLTLQHRCLGKVFEVRCLHIPVNDRTRFQGLLQFVEEAVRFEHSVSPNKPIYIVGDTFGGSVALAVAARNPAIDMILIVSNPVTSISKLQLQQYLSILEALPKELHISVPYIFSFAIGDVLKLGMSNVEKDLSPPETILQLPSSLVSLLTSLPVLAAILPMETLFWRLKLLESAASYANSRLHAIKAEVLVLVSGKGNMLPSRDEAQYLWRTLKNCKVRYFKDNGHSLLLEDGFNLLTVIKAVQIYRRSRKFDYVLDYLPPTRKEFINAFDKDERLFKQITSPVMLSTLKDGKIVRGLSGVPNEGPVLLVGYHMLFGFELAPLVEAFLREKNVLIRGIAHPSLFSRWTESSLQEMSRFDTVRVFGALPVSASNFYRLFSSRSFVLLYPGGAREALHRKGEEYKLFWPDQPEFVRMAARFGATIVPFGVVGEDDIIQYVFDYNDQIKIPYFREWIKDHNEGFPRLRVDINGELANQDFFIPGILPKVPGRFYFLFGRPVETKGQMEILKDKQKANELYLQIKTMVESSMSYLRKKREDDPYRDILKRSAFQVTWGSNHEVPTFEP